MRSVYRMGKPHSRGSTREVKGRRCEATITPRWYHDTDKPQCSFLAVVQVGGKWLCKLHARKV